MAHVKADRVQETTTTTGTGALTLAGATTKFRAFSAALADTDTCVCLIEHASAAEWEVSLCTFASGAGTLTRSTIYAGTNGGSAVNFSAGTKTISLLPTASKMIVADNSDATTIPGALLPAANDGGALGSATLSFSDGFFASGAVFNFGNGNAVITHSSGAIAITTGTLGVGAAASSLHKFEVSQNVADTGLIARVLNSNTGGNNADAVFAMRTESGGGDSYMTYAMQGIINWYTGSDRSDSGKYKIGATGGGPKPGAGDFITITTAGRVGIGTTGPTGQLHVAGSSSQVSWTTTGVGFGVIAGTYTDTSGSGTIGSRAANSFGVPTLASSSSVTLTDAASVYIEGPPTAGSNTTITNPWAIWVDSGNARFDGSLVSSSASGGVGYMTGAGGTVTQATSKSTGVTLNKTCGQITMHNANLAADARVSFTVTNSSVATTDVIVANVDSGGTANAYLVYVTAVGAGSFALTVENATGGDLAEAPVISFAVIKGVTS